MRKSNESLAWQAAAHIVLFLFAAAALIPFVLLIIASFTDNNTAMVNGYSFFPEKWSLEAYAYIGREWRTVGRAYLMTIVVTVIGTAGSMAITSMFAYALSNRELPGQKILMFMCIFTMLFNGGIVSSYYMYSAVFQIKNTIWALILPNLLMNAFTVILMRNYFVNSISPSITEAARIDGAGAVQRFFRITFPLLTPVVFFNLIMQVINAFQEFTTPFVITGGGPARSTYLYAMMIYENGFKFLKMGYASALSWLMFLVIILLTALVFKSSPYWVHYSDGGE